MKSALFPYFEVYWQIQKYTNLDCGLFSYFHLFFFIKGLSINIHNAPLIGISHLGTLIFIVAADIHYFPILEIHITVSVKCPTFRCFSFILGC